MIARVFLSTLYLFIGVFLFLLPELTQGRRLFGVELSQKQQLGVVAREAIARYRSAMLGTIIPMIGISLLLPSNSGHGLHFFVFLPIAVVAVIAFNWQHRKLLPLAQGRNLNTRSIELSEEPDRANWIALFGSLPLLLLALVTTILQALWDRIPQRVPIHYGVNGADRFVERSPHAVFGPVLIAFEICVWLLVIAFAAWAGMRRSNGRSLFTGLMLWLEYLLASLCSAAAFSPSLPSVPPLWIPLGVMLACLGAGIFALRRLHSSENSVESTPEDCWKGGLFYFNRNDPALLVEVREGNNFMFNFANPMSWGILCGTVLLVGLVILQVNWFFN